ncbi:hypothetical protein ColLi_13712 [Colletotrichum liriopes]|uniref:Uncharacterized protein n=1 Tax=Colletotrichum liriopes TaxID=708192 RepID=A0AA37H1N5_9PEZI|nr:hypothetical protein ColLi_13712 [Colletotrichum liriopes]
MPNAAPPTTPEAWKLWAKQQTHPMYFLTNPNMFNTYKFDKELGGYLSLCGNAVIQQLERVVWDEKAQAPANKTKQRVCVSLFLGPLRVRPDYAPSASDFEALRIVNGPNLPSDVLDLLSQTGWDPFKCCGPSLKAQERKLRPESTGYNPRLSSSHFYSSHPSSAFDPAHRNKAIPSASFITNTPLQINMTPQPNPKTATTPKAVVCRPALTLWPSTSVTNTTSLPSQSMFVEQTPKTTNPLPKPVTNVTTQKPASQVTPKTVMASSSKSAAKATPKRGRATTAKTTAKTPIGWKRWAKKQKNAVYSEPAFQDSSNTVDSYLTSCLSWNEEGKKPADISHQLPYSQLVAQWESIKKGGQPPSASMMEAIRIMNSLAIPDNIVGMLKEAGWDADKCCNPKLPLDQRKLGARPTKSKRGIEDEGESSPRAKRQNTTAVVPQQEYSNAVAPSPEIPAFTHQSSREPLSVSDHDIVKAEKASPMPAILRQDGSFHSTNIPEDDAGEDARDDSSSNGFNRGGPEVDMEPRVDPIIIGAAVDNTQPAVITKSPKMTKLTNSENSSPGSAHEIETSKSNPFKRSKRTSRKEMKRAIDAVSNSLTVMTASHSVKLQDQASRLSEHSEQFDVHSGQLQEQTNQLYEHADRLHNHSNQLQKQELALEQLRRDNQALRDCLQGVLLPLAQAVNTLHKSSKADKRTLKSTKKRAERELEEFKSADKTTKVLERNLTHLRRLLGAVEDRHKGMNEAQGQEI